MIDAHAHLTDKLLDGEEIASSMSADGLECIVNIGTSLDDSQKGIEFANTHKNVYTTVGVHPWELENLPQNYIEVLEHLAVSPKVVAIGEIGLDYHFNPTAQQIELQKQVFMQQLKLAGKLGLPIVIHCRDAADDVLQILSQNKDSLKAGVCMHCYSEGAAYVNAFKNLGCYFSFTGNVTYKKTDISYFGELPKDKVMVETDSPYLAPVPLRGSVNQPKNVKITAAKVADLLHMDYASFDGLSSANTKRFFNITD